MEKDCLTPIGETGRSSHSLPFPVFLVVTSLICGATDVVDINPEIFTVAETHFGFRNRGGRFVEDARYFLNKSGRKFTLPSDAPGIILTDNYNPIDSWDLRLKEAFRGRALRWTDKDMLL
jgi:hypothetical protein